MLKNKIFAPSNYLKSFKDFNVLKLLVAKSLSDFLSSYDNLLSFHNLSRCRKNSLVEAKFPFLTSFFTISANVAGNEIFNIERMMLN